MGLACRLPIEGLWLARRSSVSRALGSPLRARACGRVDVHSCSARVVRPSCSVCGWLAAPYARDRFAIRLGAGRPLVVAGSPRAGALKSRLRARGFGSPLARGWSTPAGARRIAIAY